MDLPGHLIDDFMTLRQLAGLSTEACAEYLGVSVWTIRRYEQRGAPRAAMLAVAFKAGFISAIFPEWYGFHLKDGLLSDDTGNEYTPGDIRAMHYLRQMTWHRVREKDELRAKVASLEEQVKEFEKNSAAVTGFKFTIVK